MSQQTFKTILSADQDLNRIQANISDSLNPLLGSSELVISYDLNGKQSVANSDILNPFSGGSIVSAPLTSGQDNLIPHGLTRTPSIWILCNQDSNAVVWSPATPALKNNFGPQNSNSTFINLQSSADCNISIWVN